MVIEYLLDTNQVCKLLDNHPAVVNQVASIGIGRIYINPIICGEIHFMAWHSQYKIENLEKITNLIHHLKVISIDAKTAAIYGELKERFVNRFSPQSSKERTKFSPTKIGLNDNDLWIASTAIQNRLSLVSDYKDFLRIREVYDFNMETWWSPQ